MTKEQHHITNNLDKVPFSQKVAYGLGSIVNNLLGSVIGYMSIVLTVGLGINPALVGLLQAIPRFTDAFTDPIMGYISDNTKTKYGRRRPYIFVGAILTGITFAIMWQLPAGFSEMFYFWFFLIGSIVFYLFYTMFATPYVALGYELSQDYHERTRVLAVANFMGQIAWIILPWLYAFMENDNFFTDSVEGARTLAIILGIVVATVGILPAVFTKEKYVATTSDNVKNKLFSGLWENLKLFFKGFLTAIKRSDFLKLCIATLFLFNAMNLVGAFGSFIIIYYVSGGDSDMGAKFMGLYGTINTISTFIAIPAATWLSTKIGKKKAFVITTSIMMIGSIIKWFCYDPLNPWKVLIPAPFIAVGMGALFTLIGSMIADVCDLDELETGERREGMYGAIYWWMVKIGMAAAFALSGFMLNATGFDVNLGGAQMSKTFLWMRIIDVAVPTVGSLIAIFSLAMFTITEDKAYEIRTILEKRKQQIN